jgi:uncharacterized protein (TIGR01777 family)
VSWDPGKGDLDPTDLVGVDATVNLAGVGFGDRRWTEPYKRSISKSRTDSTGLIARALVEVGSQVLVSASAVGYYGDRGDEIITEASPPGDDFAAQVCVRWEAATAPAESAGIRVAHIRSGLVMSSEGGLLGRLLLPFKLGIGGRIGSGRQYWSWIDVADEVAAIRHLLARNDLSGPFNLTAPRPLTFDDVKKVIARVLHRPAIFGVPDFAIRALFGRERADNIVLSGQRVLPGRLVESGFQFRFSEFEASLRHQLDRQLAS